MNPEVLRLSLISDLGPEEHYTAILRTGLQETLRRLTGVMPWIENICQTIQTGDALQAAWQLTGFMPFAVPGTLHVLCLGALGQPAPVRLIQLKSSGQWIIGPDDGTLNLVVGQEEYSVWTPTLTDPPGPATLTNSNNNTLTRPHPFTPWLRAAALWTEARKTGAKEELDADINLRQLIWPTSVEREFSLHGHILHFDFQGNASTNLPREQVLAFARRHARNLGELEVQLGTVRISELAERLYENALEDELLIWWGPDDHLQFGFRRLSLKNILGSVGVYDPVVLHLL